MTTTDIAPGTRPRHDSSAHRVVRESLSDRIRPYLAEIAGRAQATEDARTVPAENFEIIVKAGFIRSLVPTAYGGEGRDLADYCAAVRLLASACPSTAWVAGVLGIHPAGVVHFDPSVQREIWADGADTVICSSGSPSIKARITDGGIVVNGRARWSSGSDHAQWALVGVKVPDIADPHYPERRYRDHMFAVHRSDFTIEDTWYSKGMRGSGSKDLVFDDLFVPHRRMEDLWGFNFGHSKGARTVDSWLAASPYILVFNTFLPAVALGCADGMVAEYRKRQRSRKNAYTGAHGILNPAGYMRLAESVHELESLGVYFDWLLDKAQHFGDRDQKMSDVDLFDAQAPLGFVTERAVAVIDRLFQGAGSSAIADFNPMQRFWRDGHTVRLHSGSDYDQAMQHHGRILIGLPPTPDL